MDSLEKIYRAILENEVSTGFSLAIAIVLGLSLLSRLPGFARFLGAFDRSGAGVMTTLGVLGTFTGIFLGLIDFNVSQIDTSVPNLLEGLKIAFATSIIGMGAAISFKLIQGLTPQPTTDDIEATPEDILATLRSINDSVDRSSESHREALNEVRRAISSDNDSSLLTQVQKLRTSMQDGQQELIKEFREFAQTMAESNSKALIEALEQVIRDFNTQLNEQFGENFKQLNEAVGALLTWQENYREHVETLEARIDAAVEALESSEESLGQITSNTERIPEMLSPLEALLTGLSASIKDLEEHLRSVAELKEQAVQAFPVIEENLERMTKDVGEAISTSVETMSSSVTEQRAALDQLRSGYDELKDTASKSQREFSDALSDALDQMQRTLEKALEGHANAIDATAEELRNQTTKSWQETQEHINAQFETMDDQMQKELTRVMELMGSNLASLSEKFVEDYEPLTNRLREIVQIAGRSS